MAAPPPQYRSYSSNAACGHAIQIMGDINGSVHLQNGASMDQCLRELRITDPREDKDRIEASKDRLLSDCYAWGSSRTHDDAQLFWVGGDPGKGKTMMMTALFKEPLGRSEADPG
jgi:hypothetical protein